MKILVIEDKEINQKIIKLMLLKLCETDIDIAENGLIGLQRMLEKVYDVIFLDIRMPVMDGYEVLSKLSKRKNKPYVIVLTANVLDSEKDKCMSLGANEYIMKPYTISVLRNILSKLKNNGDNSTGNGSDGASLINSK